VSRRLEAVLGLRNETKAELKKFEQQVGKMSDKVIGLSKKAGIAVAGLAVGVAIVGAKFEQSMANVGAVTNATAEDMGRLSAKAKELGRTTVFSASQAAEAFYNLGSAGMDAEKSIAAIPGVLALAAAEGAELGQATEAVVSSMGQFSLEASEAARVANLFAAGVSGGLQKLPDLQEAMKNTGKAAKQAGLDMETTVALVTEFANLGEKGGIAGTHIQQALLKLIKPTGHLKDVLGGLNLTNTEFIDLLQVLEHRGYTAQNAMQDLGARGMGLATILQIGSGQLGKMTESLTGTETATRKQDQMLNTLIGDIRLMKSALEGAGIELYEAFKPELRDAVQRFAEEVQKLGQYIIDNKDEIARGAKAAYEGLKDVISWLIDHKSEIFLTLEVMFGAAILSKVIAMRNALAGLAGTAAFKWISKVPPQAWLVAAAVAASALSIRELKIALDDAAEAGKNWQQIDIEGPKLPMEDTGFRFWLTGEVDEDGTYKVLGDFEAILPSLETEMLIAPPDPKVFIDWNSEARATIEALEEIAVIDPERQRELVHEAQKIVTEYYRDLGVRQEEARDYLLMSQMSQTDRELMEAQRRADELSALFAADAVEQLQIAEWLADERYRIQTESEARTVAEVAEIRRNAQMQALEDWGSYWDILTENMNMAANLIAETEKTGGEKWVAAREAIYQKAIIGVVGWVAKTLKQYWLEVVGKRAVENVLLEETVKAETLKTVAKTTGTSARLALDATERAAMLVATTGAITNMAAEVTAFYAPMGPVGIPLAAATIESYKALIAASKVGGYASGGRVLGGTGDRADDVPIRVSRDEFIIQASAARSIGYDTLGAMNTSGALPLAGGGALTVAPTIQVNAPPDAVARIEETVEEFFWTSAGMDLIEELIVYMITQGRLRGVF